MHKISITNVKNEEVFTYSVVIVKGSVANEHKVCPGEDHIAIKHDDWFFEVGVISNNFKFFCELSLGLNIISLEYCCATLSIKLWYTPCESKLTVLPVYIICDGHDGRFQAPDTQDNSIESACKRITVSTKLIQGIIAEKLYEQGFERKMFHLESDCVVFSSKLSREIAKDMSQNELWLYFAQEIMSSRIASCDKKYLGFLSFTNYRGDMYNEMLDSYHDLIGITEGYVALGGGGLALFGTACLYTWAESVDQVKARFEDTTIVDKRRFLDDSCYRGTNSSCYSTTLGSVLHELCHAFGLGHSESGIMGRGFDKVGDIFTNNQNPDQQCTDDQTYFTKNCAAFLNYHRWFNPSVASFKLFVLKYETDTKLIKSTVGLRVVELREEITELVVESWTFLHKVLKFQFQIPLITLEELTQKVVVLVVEDDRGNILKETIVL